VKSILLGLALVSCTAMAAEPAANAEELKWILALK
jgi:hypothetical protein